MRQPPEALSPYDCVLKAIPLIFEMSPEAFAEAGRLLQRALADDPHEPLAYAWRAFWGCVQLGQGWAGGSGSPPGPKWTGWCAGHSSSTPGTPSPSRSPVMPLRSTTTTTRKALELFRPVAQARSQFAARAGPQRDHPVLRRQSRRRRCAGCSRYEEIWPYDPHPYFHRTTTCIALALAGRYEQAVQLGRLDAAGEPELPCALSTVDREPRPVRPDRRSPRAAQHSAAAPAGLQRRVVPRALSAAARGSPDTLHRGSAQGRRARGLAVAVCTASQCERATAMLGLLATVRARRRERAGRTPRFAWRTIKHDHDRSR